MRFLPTLRRRFPATTGTRVPRPTLKVSLSCSVDGAQSHAAECALSVQALSIAIGRRIRPLNAAAGSSVSLTTYVSGAQTFAPSVSMVTNISIAASLPPEGIAHTGSVSMTVQVVSISVGAKTLAGSVSMTVQVVSVLVGTQAHTGSVSMSVQAVSISVGAQAHTASIAMGVSLSTAVTTTMTIYGSSDIATSVTTSVAPAHTHSPSVTMGMQIVSVAAGTRGHYASVSMSVQVVSVSVGTKALAASVSMTTSFSAAVTPTLISPLVNTYSIEHAAHGYYNGIDSGVIPHSYKGDNVSLWDAGFTLSTWVNFDSTTQVAPQTLFATYFHAGNSNLQWRIGGGVSASADKWWTYLGSTQYAADTSSTDGDHGLSPDTWYHLALTFERNYKAFDSTSTKNCWVYGGEVRIYVDGVESLHLPYNTGAGVGDQKEFVQGEVQLDEDFTSTYPGDGDTFSIKSDASTKTYGAPTDMARSGAGVTEPQRILQIGTEQIRVTAAGNAATHEFTVETDGRGYNGTTAQAHSDGDLVRGLTTLGIGCSIRYNWPQGGLYPINGHQDEAVIHDACLTQSEVDDLSNGGTEVRSPLVYGKPANCVGWWRMGDNNDTPGEGELIPNMATGSNKVLPANAKFVINNASKAPEYATDELPPE